MLLSTSSTENMVWAETPPLHGFEMQEQAPHGPKGLHLPSTWGFHHEALLYEQKHQARHLRFSQASSPFASPSTLKNSPGAGHLPQRFVIPNLLLLPEIEEKSSRNGGFLQAPEICDWGEERGKEGAEMGVERNKCTFQ